MSEVAIRVEGLSKRYTIGTRGTHADEFRGRLAGAATAPFRKLFGRNGRRRGSEFGVQCSGSREQNNEPSTKHEPSRIPQPLPRASAPATPQTARDAVDLAPVLDFRLVRFRQTDSSKRLSKMPGQMLSVKRLQSGTALAADN